MSTLEKVTQFCIIVLCVVGVTAVINQQINVRRASPGSRPADFIGKQVSLPGVDWNRSSTPTSVVLVITSHCSHCIASLPLYRDLTKLSQTPGRGVSLLVVSAEPASVIQKFLADNGVNADRVIEGSLATIGVVATPTLLVVDAGGKVRNAFIGEVGPESQPQLLALGSHAPKT